MSGSGSVRRLSQQSWVNLFGILVTTLVLATALVGFVSGGPVNSGYYPAESRKHLSSKSYPKTYLVSKTQRNLRPTSKKFSPIISKPTLQISKPKVQISKPRLQISKPRLRQRQNVTKPVLHRRNFINCNPLKRLTRRQKGRNQFLNRKFRLCDYQAPYEPSYSPPSYESYSTYESQSYSQPEYQSQPEYPSYQQPYEPQPEYPSYQPEYPAYQQPEYPTAYQQPEYGSYKQEYPSYKPEYPSYQPEYPSYKPEYQPENPSYQPPAYSPEPSYPSYQQPSYPEPEPYKPAYEPSYKPTYEPSYKPAYEPSYKPSYEPSYKPSSYAKTEYYPEYVNYEAITYRDLNESIHCGVIPAVNSELYKNSYGGYQYQGTYGGKGSTGLAHSTPTLPFGKFPWIALITDDYYNILCEATIVNHRYVLTLSSCVDSYPLHKLRIRYGEWDILNNAKDYEVYKNVEARICRKLPVTCPYGYSPSYGYQKQNYKSEGYYGLTLLQSEFQPDYDVYPQVRHVCLPEYYYQQTYKPSYQKPAYQAPAPAPYQSYQAPQQSYSPAPYTPPSTYYQPPTYEYYSECYVAGYYGSPTSKLENHKRPTPYEGYGYQSANYYPQTSAYSSYSESYESKTPKITKVKPIKCESYNGYKKPQGYYGQSSCEENICFVGVEGDACVADYGSAIVCLVPDKYGYDSGYSYPYDEPSYGYQTPAQSSYSSSYSTPYGSYQQNYKKDIKAAPAQEKVERKRAAIVAVVKHLAQCSSASKPQGYGYQTQEYQSKPIVAIKVTEKVVDFILGKFFEGVADHSCPAPAYYKAPEYYKPAYTPQPTYSPPSYSSPSYSPPYPSPSYKGPV